MANYTPDEIAALREQFRKLNEELKSLGGQAFSSIPSDVNDLIKNIRVLSNEIEDIKNAFGSISQILRNTITDFNSYGKLISSINGAYSKLSSLTARVQQHVSGINALNVKDLRIIKDKAKAEVDFLKSQQDTLQQKIRELEITEQNNGLTAVQSRQLQTLQAQQIALNGDLDKETGILEEIDGLLEEQIIKEKEINTNLGLTGKLFKGISGTLRNLGVDSESIDEINKKLREAAGTGKLEFSKSSSIIRKELTKSLEDPLVRFSIALRATKSGFSDIKKAFDVFLEFDKIFAETARSLGMSVSQIQGMTNAAKLSGDQFGNNAYTAEQITKAISESNAQLGLSVDLGAATTSEFAAMTNQMGLSAEEATKIYKLGTLNNMSLKDTNKAISAGIIAAQKQTGVQVNAKQVFQEIGKLSAGITAKFQQNPEALAKAVAQAKALGTNLEQVDKVGESLLNFETSIENELKAELLTGRQINVEKARYAALTGDQATLTRELANEVGSLAEFQEMNVLAQKSLAEAFGLSRDEVAGMLQQQETFNKLGDVSGKSAAEQLKIARERNLSEEDLLVKNLQQQAASEKLAATFDSLKVVLAEMVTGPFGGLVDMMSSLAKNATLVKFAMGAIATISLAKTIGGLATMAVELGLASVGAAATASAITLGLGTFAIIAALSALTKSTTDANNQVKSDIQGTAFASGGIVTGRIDNATVGEAGPEAIIPLNSPKASNMLGMDIAPMVNAINEVKSAVASLANRPVNSVLNIDGRAIGTAVGRQMETGTSQIINTGYQLA